MDGTASLPLPALPMPPAALMPGNRRLLAGRIGSHLVGADAPGALVAGGPGTGKTTLARRVLGRLDAGVHVERVRGGPTVSMIPYGAIHYLLSEVDLQLLRHPVHTVAAVRRLLRARAGGRKIVVFADNAHLLDDQAAAVLAQLAADRTITLLLCAEDASRIPPSLAALRSNGLLHRFELQAFSFEETAEWCPGALGGPVAGHATYELFAASGGNPLLLNVLAEEWLQAGVLHRQEGTWFLAGGSSKPGAALDEVRPAQLAGLTVSQRALAEILALAGSLPMALVCRIGADEDFGELQGRGLVALHGGRQAAARISDALLAEVLRRAVPPKRSRELLGTVLDAGGWDVLASAGPGGTGVCLARWVLASGIDLAPEHAVAAARAALELGDAALARRLAERAAGHPAAAVVLAGAALAQHDIQAATEAVASLDGMPARGVDTGAEDRRPAADTGGLDLALIRSRLARVQPPTDGSAACLLAAARAGLAPGTPAARKLELAQAELAVHEGRFGEIGLDRLYAGLHSHEPVLQHQTAVLLVEVLAATGRQADAERLGDELADQAQRMSGLAGPGEEAAAGIRQHLRSMGLWEGYARLLSRQHGHAALHDRYLWAHTEIADGLRRAEAGQAREALAAVLPVMRELQHPPGSPLLPLAAAACAYVCALLGDGDGVRAHLAASGSESLPWQSRAAARYYQIMARATVTSYPAAAAELHREGIRAERTGGLAAALRFASGAVRLGDAGALPMLVSLARRVQGPFAQACARFGGGLLAEDPAALVAAARLAAEEGSLVFSREAARLALALASRCGDTALMRTAQQYIYADSSAFDFCTGRLGGGQALTAREREVARLVAAGLSNTAVAGHFGVSVRTIEGHLYKLYAKLQPGPVPVSDGEADQGRVRYG